MRFQDHEIQDRERFELVEQRNPFPINQMLAGIGCDMPISLRGSPDDISQKGDQQDEGATFFKFPQFGVSLTVLLGVAMSRMGYAVGPRWQLVLSRRGVMLMVS